MWGTTPLSLAGVKLRQEDCCESVVGNPDGSESLSQKTPVLSKQIIKNATNPQMQFRYQVQMCMGIPGSCLFDHGSGQIVCHPPICGDKSNMPDQKMGGQSSCWSIF